MSLPKGFKHSEETKRKISAAKQGNRNRWKGGVTIDKGYAEVFMPEHPFAKKSGYIRAHRIVIEKQIGRYLKNGEVVHHINRIKTDNRPENLICFRDHASHRRFECSNKFNPDDIIFDGGDNNPFFWESHSHSIETIEKIRKKKNEYYKTHQGYWFGKRRSAETISKIRESQNRRISDLKRE